MASDDHQRRAELYLRGDTYGTYEAQQAVLKRVEALAAGDALDEAEVADEWQRIRTTDEDRRDGAVETYVEFADWAERNGYSLGPAFEQRTRSYVGLDRVDDVVVFPVVSLAVYEDDRLRGVFPCSDDERTYRVQDCLEAFERGDADWLAQFDAVTVDRTEPRLEPATGD
ncbi:HTH domain-containing protein [Halomicrobium salinisoli]|uniref:HTH domain-containing protein n=1 Tax=Halomicrobium salinisoli TaxID=2878391 RepID=UPI001CF08EF3|nr:HTH domain-containing protein [Halomicrobium salinisoli]